MTRLRQLVARISAPVWWLLLAALLALLLLLPIRIPLPGNVVLEAPERRVRFYVDDTLLFKPGDCVQVGWDVAGVQAVFADGEGTIGAYEKQVCLDGRYTPTLRILWPDDTSETFRIPLQYALLSPLWWLLAAVTTFALIAGLVGFIRRAIGPRLRPLEKPVNRLRDLFVLLILTLLALEFGLRAFYEAYGTPTEKLRYLVAADDLQRRAELGNLVHPVPFINYLPELGQINRLGYRGEMVAIPKPAGVFRVVALGGSTTYGTGTSAEESYPAHLQRILRSEYGYSNVEVVNAGVPSWNTWHSLSNLAFRVLELEPDLIIVFHAINDVFPRVMPEQCYSGIRPYLGLPPNIGFYQPAALDFGPSTLYRFVAVNLGWLPDPAGQASGIEVQFQQSLCPQGRLNDLATLEANPPRYFERNLRSMVGIAQAHDVAVMFASWTYYDLRDWEVRGVAQHNAITEALAQELGLPFYDLAADYPRDISLWAEDLQHMNGAGSRVQAGLFAEFMHTNGLLPTP